MKKRLNRLRPYITILRKKNGVKADTCQYHETCLLGREINGNIKHDPLEENECQEVQGCLEKKPASDLSSFSSTIRKHDNCKTNPFKRKKKDLRK